MLIGALGAGAVSRIADALTSRNQPTKNLADTPTTQQPVSTLQPSGTDAIGTAASKLITDLKSLLLSLQASDASPYDGSTNTSTSTGETSPAGATSTGPTASGAGQTQPGAAHHHHHGRLAQAINAYGGTNPAAPAGAAPVS